MATDFDPGDLLGSGRVAEVFSHGPNVIKLYRPGHGKREVFREAATLAVLEDSGLPVPTIKAARQYGQRWGIELSRAPKAEIPLNLQELAELMAVLQQQIHAVRGKPLTRLKQKLSRNIREATQLEPADRARLLSKLADFPDDDQLCHGDFHPGNIMGTAANPYVIDWLDATSGPAQADVCRTYLLALHHIPGLAVPYLEAYLDTSGDQADQVLLWLPIIAAARLSEGVVDEVPRLLAIATANA